MRPWAVYPFAASGREETSHTVQPLWMPVQHIPRDIAVTHRQQKLRQENQIQAQDPHAMTDDISTCYKRTRHDPHEAHAHKAAHVREGRPGA